MGAAPGARPMVRATRAATQRASSSSPRKVAIAASSARPTSCSTIVASGQNVMPSPYDKQRPDRRRGGLLRLEQEAAHQERLADPGGSEDGDQPSALLGSDVGERPLQHRALAIAPHHAWGGRGRCGFARGRQRHEPPGWHRLGLSLEVQWIQALQAGTRAQQPCGLVVDEDLVGGSRGLEALSEVDRVAEGEERLGAPTGAKATSPVASP